jgi:hypothetical protein
MDTMILGLKRICIGMIATGKNGDMIDLQLINLLVI